MRALRLLEWKSDPVLTEVPEPEPGPGQVVVRVGGAGACHSDLHLMREFSSGQLPRQTRGGGLADQCAHSPGRGCVRL